MKKNNIIFITISIFVVLFIGASILYNILSQSVEKQNMTLTEQNTREEEYADDTEEANPAPDFYVEDKDGNTVYLSDFSGKPVIVNFWASWCGPCQSEMPDFDDFYAEYGDDIIFMMVNLTDGSRETTDSAMAFIEEKGYTFPVYFDTDLNGASTYGASSIPATYFIDAKGNLMAYAKGALDATALQQGIDMILPVESKN